MLITAIVIVLVILIITVASPYLLVLSPPLFPNAADVSSHAQVHARRNVKAEVEASKSLIRRSWRRVAGVGGSTTKRMMTMTTMTLVVKRKGRLFPSEDS